MNQLGIGVVLLISQGLKGNFVNTFNKEGIMARKEQISKQMILDGAFQLVREQGIEMLTARKLAAHIGCSTQPIFRVYANMDELEKEVFEKAKAFYEQYCLDFPNENEMPFIDLGLCYITFAKKELNLFKLLFLTPHDEENTMYDLINGAEHGFVISQFRRIKNLDMNKAGDIFMKVFIFMHGMACMAICGELDLSKEEILPTLKETIEGFF